MGRVTINDIAKQAGVSHTTVSWVIHDDPRISRETKDKVLAVIAELKYHPNLSARSLISGKSGVIAVVASFFSTVFELEVMRGIEEGLDGKTEALGVQLYSTRGSRERKDSLLRSILYGHRADAVICLSLRPDDELTAEYHNGGVPLILIEEQAEGAISVKTQNHMGARLAVDHLISRGKKNIGLVSGTLMDYAGDSGISPQERFNGYKESLENAGIPFVPNRIVEIRDYYQEEGRDALTSLLAADPTIDGIFCSAGDLVALGIITETRARKIRVPEDIAVVGFDDTFVAPLITPPLTTIRQPLRIMGRTALELTLDSLAKKPVESRLFTPELIIREST